MECHNGRVPSAPFGVLSPLTADRWPRGPSARRLLKGWRSHPPPAARSSRPADGEACICDLTAPVALSQPTVSHHMKVLTDAGLLHREQRGKWAYYRLVPDALDALAALLSTR